MPCIEFCQTYYFLCSFLSCRYMTGYVPLFFAEIQKIELTSEIRHRETVLAFQRPLVTFTVNNGCMRSQLDPSSRYQCLVWGFSRVEGNCPLQGQIDDPNLIIHLPKEHCGPQIWHSQLLSVNNNCLCLSDLVLYVVITGFRNYCKVWLKVCTQRTWVNKLWTCTTEIMVCCLVENSNQHCFF